MPKMPGVNHLHAVRALEKVGFQIARQGKHIVMTDVELLDESWCQRLPTELARRLKELIDNPDG